MAKNLELDLPFGAYNAPSKNNFKKFVLDNNSYSKESFVNELIREKLTNNIYQDKVFFKAIVLKVEENNYNAPDILNLSNIFNLCNPVRFYARIPEIHSHIPISEDLDNIPEEILFMYPLFEGSTALGVPKVGSTVTVSFQNVEMQSGGKYIENSENTSSVGNNSPGAGDSALRAEATDPEATRARGNNKNAKSGDGKSTSEGLSYYERGGLPIDLIVIHESAGGGVSREGVVKSLAKDGFGVHYTITRDGVYKKHIEERFQTIHGDGPKVLSNTKDTGVNKRSIGIEIINRVNGDWKKDPDEIVVDVPWKVVDSRSGNILPTFKQCESCWELIKSICSRNNIPIFFYAQNGIDIHYNRKNSYAKGISCHKRYDGNRADGPFVENYCYLRSLGHSPKFAAKILFEDIFLSMVDRKKSHNYASLLIAAKTNPEKDLFRKYIGT